ncbi:hypothetical protein IAD21_00294 [Abditibacteriota bacterium]|nr:hypothetical protein IAD21_00294 [Abditibacteriota bacterium]
MHHYFSRFYALGLCSCLLYGCTSNNSSTAGNQSASSAPATNVLTPKGATNFSSKEANFAIYFPGKVTPSQSAGSSQWGDYQTFTYSCKAPSVSYVVIATTIPSGVDTSDPVSFINGVQKGLLKSSGATIDRSRELTLNTTPGRELYTTIKAGGNTGKSRVFIFVTPTISYQIMAVGLDGEFQTSQAQTQIEKVLGSFRLLAK